MTSRRAAVLFLSSSSSPRRLREPGAAARNALRRPIRVILISIDGFRADYLDRGLTPTLAALAADGVRADALKPAFPTLTFPNHYTLVTGLYPDHHGIVDNRMVDPVSGKTVRLQGCRRRSPIPRGGAASRYGSASKNKAAMRRRCSGQDPMSRSMACGPVTGCTSTARCRPISASISYCAGPTFAASAATGRSTRCISSRSIMPDTITALIRPK